MPGPSQDTDARTVKSHLTRPNFLYVFQEGAGCAGAWPPSPPAFGPAVRPYRSRHPCQRPQKLSCQSQSGPALQPARLSLQHGPDGGPGPDSRRRGARVRPSTAGCGSRRHRSGSE